ncbi:hypothetical protein EDD11_000287 [Mortierella claussenii]|nr:hypothetical protein EDD11_000287 [Mortierella claussenii]
MAQQLQLDQRTIQVWFQNRRAKLKRDESLALAYFGQQQQQQQQTQTQTQQRRHASEKQQKDQKQEDNWRKEELSLWQSQQPQQQRSEKKNSEKERQENDSESSAVASAAASQRDKASSLRPPLPSPTPRVFSVSSNPSSSASIQCRDGAKMLLESSHECNLDTSPGCLSPVDPWLFVSNTKSTDHTLNLRFGHTTNVHMSLFGGDQKTSLADDGDTDGGAKIKHLHNNDDDGAEDTDYYNMATLDTVHGLGLEILLGPHNDETERRQGRVVDGIERDDDGMATSSSSWSPSSVRCSSSRSGSASSFSDSINLDSSWSIATIADPNHSSTTTTMMSATPIKPNTSTADEQAKRMPDCSNTTKRLLPLPLLSLSLRARRSASLLREENPIPRHQMALTLIPALPTPSAQGPDVVATSPVTVCTNIAAMEEGGG